MIWLHFWGPIAFPCQKLQLLHEKVSYWSAVVFLVFDFPLDGLMSFHLDKDLSSHCFQLERPGKSHMLLSADIYILTTFSLFSLSLWFFFWGDTFSFFSLQSELEIEPRYPLFGGWKATFVIGYGLPLQDFLFESSDGRRYLNFTFGCPLAEIVVDKLTIKVGTLL